MSAVAFNRKARSGYRQALKLEPKLIRQYERTLRRAATRASRRYLDQLTPVLTAASERPPIDAIIEPLVLSESITKATAATLRRMALVEYQAMAGPVTVTDQRRIIADIVDSQAGRQAERIVAGVRETVARVLLDSLTGGWSVPDTAREIRSVMVEAAPWQSTMLARTDLVGVSNATSLTAAQGLGEDAPLFKTWLATADERTRPDHRAADGQTVPLTESFVVGGDSLAYPGDPDGSDAQTINCRCTHIYADEVSGTEGIITAAASREGSMPWEVDEIEGRFCVVRADTGEEVTCHDTRAEAAAHVRALYDNVEDVTASAMLTAAISQEDRDRWAEEGVALPDGSYPIPDVEFLRKAISALGRASQNDEYDRVRRHIIKRARELDALGGLPEEWGIAAAAVSFDGEGGMVAVFPRLEQAEAMSVEGGQRPEDLHVTLCFMPEPPEDMDMVRKVLSNIALEWDVRTGVVGGVGSFAAGEDGAPKILLPDVVGLNELRAAVASALNGLYSTDHGFLPHITVAYGDVGIPDDRIGLPLTFEALSLKFGQDQETFPFQTSGVASSNMGDDSMPSGLVAEAETTHQGHPDAEKAARLADKRVALPGVHDGRREAQNMGLEGFKADGQVAAVAAPVLPPADWFDDPVLTEPTPLTVTEDGRVYGHVAPWDLCHMGIQGKCVTPPRGLSYDYFNIGAFETADETTVRVGKITVATGHADLRAGRAAAVAHYDNTGTVAAYVHAGEDEFGVWVAGALKSDVTEEQIRDMRANGPSGDWRMVRRPDGSQQLELVSVLCVPTQGYPIAALRASGEGSEPEVVSLFASYTVTVEVDDGTEEDEVDVEEPEEELSWDEQIQALNDEVERLVAAGVVIKIEMNEDDEEDKVIPDNLYSASIDREIAYRVAAFAVNGTWPSEPMSGAAFTPYEWDIIVRAGANLVDEPGSAESMLLRRRLLDTGFLIT